MKLALLQLCATRDKEANLTQALGMTQEALKAGAKFILLPEVFNTRGDSRDKKSLSNAAENIPGTSTRCFIPLAKKYKACLLLGSILEKDHGGGVYNTSVMIDGQGQISAKYRKIHLFDARIGDKIIRESAFFRAGRRLVVAKAGQFKAGLSICYDLRFPDLYQKYASRGVEVLTVPSCFTRKTGQAHWEALLRARAIENLSYVLAPNQIGMDARGIEAYGNSMIISPWGEVIARGSLDQKEIVYGHLKMEEVRKARQVLPGIRR